MVNALKVKIIYFGNFFKNFFRIKYKNFLSLYYIAKHNFNNLSEANYNLGLIQLERQNFFDSEIRFKLAIFFDRENIKAKLELIKFYFFQNKNDKTLKEIEKISPLELNDIELQEINYIKNCIRHEPNDSIPPSLILHYVEIYNYDNSTKLKILKSIKKFLLNPEILAQGPSNNILDINSGYGETANEFWELFKFSKWQGIDISSKFNNIARNFDKDGIKIYDQIFYGNFISHKFSIKYDLIFNIDNIKYEKTLDNFVKKIYDISVENALIILAYEERKPKLNYRDIRKSQAYCHSHEDVKYIFERNGFKNILNYDMLENQQDIKLLIFKR